MKALQRRDPLYAAKKACNGRLRSGRNLDEAAVRFEQTLALNKRLGAEPWLARPERDYAALLCTHSIEALEHG